MAETGPPTLDLFSLAPLAPQVQKSKETPQKYDVYLLATIPGLSYRYYRVRPSEQAPDDQQASSATTTNTSELPRKPRQQSARPPGQKLVSMENDCYTVFLDPHTNLMHSIWER